MGVVKYNHKGPFLRYHEGGCRPIHIQNGRVFDSSGNCLDEAFQNDTDAVNLIEWLNQNYYSITPEAREALIKQRLSYRYEQEAKAAQARWAELERQERLRIEQQIAEASQKLRKAPELRSDARLSRPPREPVEITDVEREIYGSYAVRPTPEPASAAPEPDIPDLEDEPVVVRKGPQRKKK